MTRAKIIHDATDWTKSRELASQRFKTDNPVYRSGTVEKIRATKQKTFVDGVPMDTIGAQRAAETMKREFVDENGNITTKYQENGRKLSNTVNVKYVDNATGLITTLAKERGKKRAQIYYSNTPMMCVVKNVFNPSYERVITVNEARAIICGNICEKTAINYLGKTKSARHVLIKNNKEQFIGAYAEKLA